MLSVVPIAQNLELGIAIAIPLPIRIESVFVLLAKYFNDLSNYKRKEFWLLSQGMIIGILSETFNGFKLHFKKLSEHIIKIKLYDSYFTKKTAEELENKLKNIKKITK